MNYQGKQFVFEETRFIDHGGMGLVHEGVRVDDRSVRVAIKTPFPHFVDTFLREAGYAKRVGGDHVVPVVDWGDAPPFIAFEFISGPTLRTVLEGRRSRKEYWSASDLISRFRQLVSAMRAINDHVVHRDLTPGNIFDDGGTLKVADFGMSKYVGEVTRADTHKGGGTFPYMAPEVWRFREGRLKEEIDWQADQYSLGAVFYEMATLQLPFAGAAPDLRTGHLYKRPALVTDIVPSLPDRLASLIARMLEKEASKRFPSWGDIAAELDAINDSSGAIARDDFAAGVARRAAAQVEQIHGRTLEQQRQMDELRQVAHERYDLYDYWIREVFGHVEKRVASVNQELGREALLFEHVNADGPVRRCGVRFAGTQSQLAVELSVLEPTMPSAPIAPPANSPPEVRHIVIRSPEPPANVSQVPACV